MAEGICFDTSIYIRALRQGQSDILHRRNILKKSQIIIKLYG